MKSILMAAGAVVLLTAGAACAQPEPPPGQTPPPRPERPEIDANKDGKISWAEFQAGETARFNMRDANKDGRIAKDERLAPPPGMTPPGADKLPEGGPPGHGHGGGFHHRMGGPGMGGGMMFERIDQNDDGFITRAEADAAAKRLFTFLDLNNDGVLSGKELPPRGMGGPHGPGGPDGPDAPPPPGKPD